ncbi:MAG: hypothetical protein GX444_03535 [Myxococcales bacterium]|nr:hypothetical protein [Myxococcales bacterium]
MNRLSKTLIFLVIAGSLSLAGMTAFAQDAPPAAAPAPAGIQKQVELPWFIMTVKPIFGGGAGSVDFEWELNNRAAEHDETVNFRGVGYLGLSPEAFFMPTKGRHFVISASLPLISGTGKFAETDDPAKRIDGDKLRFNAIHLALGLGYQWYFGAEQRTNLMLLSHLGGGTFRYAVEHDGEEYVSDPLRSWYFDISIGSTHRFANNFILGGSLDFSNLGFSGQSADDEFLDAYTEGGLGSMRLNAILGYAFF